ncbi:hypothetical protein KIN20_027718 [Parelaphostrongylus tenuis]|uniref:Microtubule-associated protein n=1 Tax=Parelaphostrongylus tenuis TaxID=148309 RepID=A0AAD5WE07_PARTN|nr:hypothetical protein KIN20_027718 [Parelaphostrongylus tenuis]
MSAIDIPDDTGIDEMDTSLSENEVADVNEPLEGCQEESLDNIMTNDCLEIFHHDELDGENEVIEEVHKEEAVITTDEIEDTEDVLNMKFCSLMSVAGQQEQSQEPALVKEKSNRLAAGACRSESPLTIESKIPGHVSQEEQTTTKQEVIAEQEFLAPQLNEKVDKEHREDTRQNSLSGAGTDFSVEKPHTLDEALESSAVTEQSKAMESLLITHEDQTTPKFNNERNLESGEYERDREVHDYEVHGKQVDLECEENYHTPEPAVHKDQMKKATEDSIKIAHVRPQSRLVRPPDRVIHTSPQKQVNRTQSATRPSSAMPKPITSSTGARGIRPPAPRSLARAGERGPVPKKPTDRTQSQPRPNAETNTKSEPTTPKVYRKVITVSRLVVFAELQFIRISKRKRRQGIDAKSDYVPPIPEKKAISQKLNWTARSKIGSLDNVKHKPAGGNVQIFDQKLEWHATSKIGSRDNINHKPGGGNVQIFDERIQYVSADRKSNSGSLGNMSSQSRTASRTTIDVLDL